jgi:hypothetical protein
MAREKEGGERDSLDTASSCQSSDCGLGNTLDIVSQYLSVSLGSTLTQTLSTLSSTGHCVVVVVLLVVVRKGEEWLSRDRSVC